MSSEKSPQMILRTNETIVREFGVSPRFLGLIVIVGIILAIIIPLALFALFRILDIDTVNAGLIFWVSGIIIGGALVIYALYLRLARHYVITNQRAIQYVGWLARKMISADYEQITDMSIVQDFFERLILGIGKLSLNTAGGYIEEINFERIDNPYGVANQVRQLCEQRHLSLGRPATAIAPPPIK